MENSYAVKFVPYLLSDLLENWILLKTTTTAFALESSEIVEVFHALMQLYLLSRYATF